MRDASLLQLMWLASPALSIGGFSYSECLEAAVDSGRVTTELQAGAWLADQLHLNLARADLAVLAQAVPAWQTGDHNRIAELNAWVLQTRESSELRAQTETLAALQPTYPLAFALAARPAHRCASAY